MSEYNEDEFIIGTFVWSFSRLNSFDSACKYEWYRHYIECEEMKGNFYGAGGGFCHKILEMYAKGELDMWDLPMYFEDHFAEEVPYDAPYNKYKDLRQDYYEKIYDYFANIDLVFDHYEILGVEKKIEFNVDKYPFIGFIDLLLRDKEDGKIILCDHKSATIKKLKSGKISKSDQQHFLEFKRQQYLYSKAVKEEYGEDSVKELRWNMFKDHDWITIPYNEDEYNEAIEWALNTIHEIENETEWEPNINKFYCKNLCGLEYCEYRDNNESNKSNESDESSETY